MTTRQLKNLFDTLDFIHLGDADGLSLADAKRLRSKLFFAHMQMEQVVTQAECVAMAAAKPEAQ